MTRIVNILRAAHCRSTHHYFAIDALSRIETVSGSRLANLLLKYHHDYLLGAKAPDTKFRDFKNHVIHVADGNWGGAAEACEKWLGLALEYLDGAKWRKAAFACGVLSHYFTDPLMPLHTGQMERESVVHRPMEWSVCKSYNEIQAQLTEKQLAVNFKLANGSNWISGAVLAGASVAHQHYHRLVEIYDLEQGCRNPKSGLNAEARERFGELFAIALAGWSQVLTRIADETTSELPVVSLSMTSLLATIDMPLSWIVGKISEAKEKRAIRAIFQEYEQTGTVRQNLPPEVKSVREQRNIDAAGTNKSTVEANHSPANSRLPAGKVDAFTPEVVQQVNETVEFETPSETARLSIVTPPTDSSAGASSEWDNAASPMLAHSNPPGDFEPRVGFSSELVDAPSIGPKTAKRFAKIGIRTIGQFLDADTASMVEQLDTRWMNENLLRDWKDQATLVCEVPALCGYKAQLLVAANCRSSLQLSIANANLLFNKIWSICESSEGQRILRSSNTPTASDIRDWIAATPQIRAAAKKAS